MEKELMKEAMHDACIRAVTEISADVKALVQAALDRETNETAKSMLSSMLENLDIAKAQDKAVCQSPGYPTTWISYGDDNFPSFAKETIAEALGEATKKGYLRPSIVDPLTRHVLAITPVRVFRILSTSTIRVRIMWISLSASRAAAQSLVTP